MKKASDKIDTFTAIDFETAQGPRWSICQVGLVKVVHGEIIDEIDILIKPPGNKYFYVNTGIHGINAKHTRSAPTFDKIWHKIEPYISNQNVVAHNSDFDFNCLKQVLNLYRLEHPTFNPHCTYKIYGKNLADLCWEHSIELNHHNALSDAKACAKLFSMHLQTL